ncbi:MAG: NusA-like transcription termination signal-binding factor [Halobacteria archaeon]
MIRLGTTELQWISALERLTRTQAEDCVGDAQRVIYVVRPGEARRTLRDPEAIQRLERALQRKIKLVESSPDPARFLADAFAPVQVETVALEEQEGSRKAYVQVPKLYRGVAIGKGGRNIALIRQLARRHLGIDEVVVGAQLKGR